MLKEVNPLKVGGRTMVKVALLTTLHDYEPSLDRNWLRLISGWYGLGLFHVLWGCPQAMIPRSGGTVIRPLISPNSL